MNFSFDFHQFLLLFIDIFKTLESVTTLSSYLKANTQVLSILRSSSSVLGAQLAGLAQLDREIDQSV